MTAIFLIRHGQASFSAADYDALSPLGFEQARLLGGQLARSGLQPDRIVAGAMRRHRETCQTALDAMRLSHDWLTDARLNEYDHVDVISRHWPLFLDMKGRADWYQQQDNPKEAAMSIFSEAVDHWQADNYDYKEGWQAFTQRVEAAFDELAATTTGTTFVFTSGGVISVILKKLLQLDTNSFQQFSATLVNSGVTRLVRRNGELQLAAFNEQLHLPKRCISYH